MYVLLLYYLHLSFLSLRYISLNSLEYKLEDSFIERYLGHLTPIEESTLMQVSFGKLSVWIKH